MAASAVTAWLNAAIASGQDEGRPALYRTLSVEFFPYGVQFVGCDGVLLFRTWAPYSDNGDFEADAPEFSHRPLDRVVVADKDKFALGFMRTLSSALGDFPAELTLSVDLAEEGDEPALGEELSKYVLTLSALGQRLACPLFEGEYPDWRFLDLGITPTERVDGMTMGTRLFASIGKLKGVLGVDCTFRATDKAIEFIGVYATAPISGLLMPMRRPEAAKSAAADSGQIEHADGFVDGFVDGSGGEELDPATTEAAIAPEELPVTTDDIVPLEEDWDQGPEAWNTGEREFTEEQISEAREILDTERVSFTDEQVLEALRLQSWEGYRDFCFSYGRRPGRKDWDALSAVIAGPAPVTAGEDPTDDLLPF